jgi:hypothetical protein
MNHLYQILKVGNYDQIRKELFDLVPNDYLDTDEVKSWFVPPSVLLTHCPELKKFLLPRLKKLVVVAKFYISPPYKGTWHHIDGTDWRNPFGLCLPILNTESTYFCWYKEDLSNFKRCVFNARPLPDSYQCRMDEVYVPIDIDKLELIDKIQITQPTFTRSDVMHNVENFQNKPRLVLMLRWCGPNRNTDVRDFADVMNFQDIVE